MKGVTTVLSRQKAGVDNTLFIGSRHYTWNGIVLFEGGLGFG